MGAVATRRGLRSKASWRDSLVQLISLQLLRLQLSVQLRPALVEHGRAGGDKERVLEDGVRRRSDVRVGVKHELQHLVQLHRVARQRLRRAISQLHRAREGEEYEVRTTRG